VTDATSSMALVCVQNVMSTPQTSLLRVNDSWHRKRVNISCHFSHNCIKLTYNKVCKVKNSFH